MKKLLTPILFLCVVLLSCNNNSNNHDASGTFEAVETIVSAEASGKILQLNINEGDELKQGTAVGFIDSTQLYLQRLQLLQNKKAILSGSPDVKPQIEVLEKELDNALADKKRIENLVKGEVASQKQLDDINSKIAVIQSKITALKSEFGTRTSSINEQSNTVQVQLAQINDQLRKCTITNPVNGTVLTKYAEASEMTVIGKPLYKIADLSTLVLRAYMTGDQFALVKLNQKVKVLVDKNDDEYQEYEGVVEWISNKAEFTPKTIQTKDERANLVYAVKIRVKNDGLLKIGMYADVKL
ncbi:MAG TPA: HlyD family efflux transporter periplasmic adaptor subunit [Cyclobacteriaceae bacterium]|nr:HlyD family efflux transporter periplasmic adaptor subunit [Cyclobacteriaceae bacterium]